MKTSKEPKLSRFQKRVEIAKDVIQQINSRKFNMKQGTYVDGLALEDFNVNCPTRELAQSKAKTVRCDCCAKGALLLSFVAKFDGMTGSEVNSSWSMLHPNVIRDSPLARVFPVGMLNKMEEVFEFDCLKDEDDYADSVREMGSQYLPLIKLRPRTRVVRMMEALIKTGGKSILIPKA